MKRKYIILALFAAVALLLTGCAMRTVEDMYALPKRSEKYSQLQSAIDAAMAGLDYCAPISGENQQTVQTADLDGDGVDEYLVFASGSWEKPLQVLIFQQKDDGSYALMDIIESNGASFEQVEYASFDEKPGMEIIIGCQVSDQVLRSVSVYSLEGDHIQQLLLVGYSRFLTCDFDEDGSYELMVLRPGEMETNPGVSVVYASHNGQITRSSEAELSVSSSQIRRIQRGKLLDGENAVFVSSTAEESRILTDILTIDGNHLSNLVLSGIGDSTVDTLRNSYIYPQDIEGDGIVEIPAQLAILPVSVWKNDEDQSLLRWFALDSQGREMDKLHTFHNFLEGWYLSLNSEWARRVSVIRGEDVFSFYMWNDDFSEAVPVFTIYTFTGSNRGEQAVADGRFLLHSGESAAYAAKLEERAHEYDITREYLTESFRLIRQDLQMN